MTVHRPASPEDYAEILSQFLSQDHGWWFDFVDPAGDHRDHQLYKLRGCPYVSESYKRLYQLEGDHIPFMKLVSRKDRSRILNAINAVKQDGTHRVSEIFHAMLPNGQERLVEVYIRSFELANGQRILASIHSDLAVSGELQWINHNVLNQLRAFVFIKEWSCDNQCFVFRYINEKLAEFLGLSDPKDALGLADSRFIPADLCEGFRLDDVAVYTAVDRNFVLIREESLDVIAASSKRGSSNSTRRLMTFKTQYFPPRDSIEPDRPQILGIAFDVSQVTDLLRAVAETSDQAVYIKDKDDRYVLANTAFCRLIGFENERQVLHKRFADLAQSGELRKRLSQHEVASLVMDVEDSDVEAIERGRCVRIRSSLFSNTDLYSTKTRIEAGTERTPHILGVASDLFPGHLGAMLDKMPQCMCVKRHRPEARGTKDEYVIAWANRNYLKLHGLNSLSQVIGKSEFELVPEAQANSYQLMDENALSVGQQLELEPGWDNLSPTERWQTMVDLLSDKGCWEYRELLDSRTGSKVTQMTRWAEHIDQYWFVVAVFSDLTQTTAEQHLYHEMTAHSVRGAVAPLELARDYIQHLTSGDWGPKESTYRVEAIRCMNDVANNIKWFLQHHLQFLRMDVKPDLCCCSDLTDLIRAEAERCKRTRLAPHGVDIAFNDYPKDLKVNADLNFFRATIAELIRNATKAMDRVKRAVKDRDNGDLTEDEWHDLGWHPGILDYTSILKASSICDGGYLKLVIEDNGAATWNSEERLELERKFASITSDPYKSQDMKLGLAFCFLASFKQQHKLQLECNEQTTRFSISIPLLHLRNNE